MARRRRPTNGKWKRWPELGRYALALFGGAVFALLAWNPVPPKQTTGASGSDATAAPTNPARRPVVALPPAGPLARSPHLEAHAPRANQPAAIDEEAAPARIRLRPARPDPNANRLAEAPADDVQPD